jgi:hypothetical protein
LDLEAAVKLMRQALELGEQAVAELMRARHAARGSELRNREKRRTPLCLTVKEETGSRLAL